LTRQLKICSMRHRRVGRSLYMTSVLGSTAAQTVVCPDLVVQAGSRMRTAHRRFQRGRLCIVVIVILPAHVFVHARVNFQLCPLQIGVRQ